MLLKSSWPFISPQASALGGDFFVFHSASSWITLYHSELVNRLTLIWMFQVLIPMLSSGPLVLIWLYIQSYFSPSIDTWPVSWNKGSPLCSRVLLPDCLWDFKLKEVWPLISRMFASSSMGKWLEWQIQRPGTCIIRSWTVVRAGSGWVWRWQKLCCFSSSGLCDALLLGLLHSLSECLLVPPMCQGCGSQTKTTLRFCKPAWGAYKFPVTSNSYSSS